MSLATVSRVADAENVKVLRADPPNNDDIREEDATARRAVRRDERRLPV